ncbi:hypothetical protein TUBRATIS_28720 [Tubulinosema ratisbonensis]|uniref:Actin n=1 Tax=Tubulinosema ratisbonensis TaxID=291195 RepID=A0A437AHY6_9MICR|nr:hypothetical protein TUBRATIS_28720 [Tubulinosema ratisbonensis]
MEPIYIYDNGTIYKKLGYASDLAPTKTSLENDLLDTIDKIHLLYTTKNINSYNELSTFYEENIVSSLFFMKTGVLDLFSYNKLTGIVVDFGGKTTISAVEDGILLNEIHLHGTEYLDQCLIDSIKKNEINYPSLEITNSFYAHKLKDDFIELREIYQQNLIKEIVNESISAAKLLNSSFECKTSLLNSLFLSGNGVNHLIYKMFCDEFNTLRNKVQFIKNYHTFLGGSIFCTVNQSKGLFISREEFFECGENVFLKRLI